MESYMNKIKRNSIFDIVAPLLMVLLFMTVYGYKSHSFSLILTFGISMGLSYVLYLFAGYRKPPEPGRILVIYLVAFIIQLVHFIEEFIAGFYTRFPTEIYHSAPYTADEFVISQAGLYILLIIGAIGIYKKWKITLIFVWFNVVMLSIVNAIMHPVYCFIVGGYFPGIITSLFGWITGPLMFIRLWEARKTD